MSLLIHSGEIRGLGEVTVRTGRTMSKFVKFGIDDLDKQIRFGLMPDHYWNEKDGSLAENDRVSFAYINSRKKEVYAHAMYNHRTNDFIDSNWKQVFIFCA